MPPPVDVWLAAGAAAVVIAGSVLAATIQQSPRPLDMWAVLLMVAAAGALAWRRTAPVAALGGAVGAVGIYLLGGYPYGPIQLCMVVAMFEVARRTRLRTSLLACGLAAIAAVAFALTRLVREADLPAVLLLGWTSWLVVPWSLGALVQVRSTAAERARHERPSYGPRWAPSTRPGRAGPSPRRLPGPRRSPTRSAWAVCTPWSTASGPVACRSTWRSSARTSPCRRRSTPPPTGWCRRP